MAVRNEWNTCEAYGYDQFYTSGKNYKYMEHNYTKHSHQHLTSVRHGEASKSIMVIHDISLTIWP